MSYNYGLSLEDLEDAKAKLKKQKNYLESRTFINETTGEIKSLLNFSYSANLSTRYYARILNKVHTFVSLNVSRGYVPIFLTITLDGFFRDCVKGDYKRYRDKRDEYSKHIPNNDRSGYYRDKMDEGIALTHKDCYKILGHQIHRFTRSSTLQSIRKNGDDYSYIRVTEGHKDGMPHVHMLMYVPKEYLSDVFLEFVKFFPAPRNRLRLTKKNMNKGKDNRDGFKIGEVGYETHGFQTQVRAAGGYILKYILKSFRNLVEEKELDYLQAWYVKNKIPRIITTHTLLSQDVYHHASLLDDDWFYLTKIRLDDGLVINRSMNTFSLTSNSNREIIYENGLYTLKNNGHIVKQFGKNKTFMMKWTTEPPAYHKAKSKIPLSLSRSLFKIKLPKKFYVYKMEEDVFIDVEIDNQQFILNTDTFEVHNKEDITPVYKLSYQSLYDLYINFYFDKFHPAKYGLVKRRLIELGLIEYEEVNLNHCSLDWGFDDETLF